jgi:hypothetical protein
MSEIVNDIPINAIIASVVFIIVIGVIILSYLFLEFLEWLRWRNVKPIDRESIQIIKHITDDSDEKAHIRNEAIRECFNAEKTIIVQFTDDE